MTSSSVALERVRIVAERLGALVEEVVFLGGATVDILGFSNRWYFSAMKAAVSHRISDGVTIRLITAPCFVATKLEAFASRGNKDYQLSHDLEDVVAVLDGRLELVDEIEKADSEVRSYLQQRIDELLHTDAFLDSLPGHLPGDAASQGRLPEILARLRRIAGQSG